MLYNLQKRTVFTFGAVSPIIESYKLCKKAGIVVIADFLIVCGQVVTLFLMMGVGYVLTKQGWFTEETSAQCTRILIYVVVSCIIITQLQIEADMDVIRSMLLSAVGMAAPFVIMLPLVQLLFRKEHPDTRIVRRFGMVYSNSSFMGLPLLAGILGESALLYGVISMLIFTLFQWTHGALTMGGKFSLKRMVVNPGMISVAIGLVLFVTGLRLPAPVNNAMEFMTDMNSPLAMVVIGSQMARADILSVFKKPKLYLAAAVKLIIVPAIVCVVLLPLELEPISYCACVVLAACPTAGTTSMFAQMFGRDVETAAHMVTLSTLLSVITLPVFAVLARQIVGLG